MPKYYNDPYAPMMEIIDYAEKNPKADVRDYIVGKFDELNAQIQALPNYSSEHKKEAIDYLNKDCRSTFTKFEKDGEIRAFIRESDFRAELARIKPLVQSLMPKSDDDSAKLSSEISSHSKFNRNSSLDTLTSVVYNKSIDNPDAATVEQSKKTLSSIYTGGSSANICNAAGGLHIFGMYSCAADILTKANAQSLTLAADKAKDQVAALHGKVVPITGSGGTPLNGQANQDQSTNKVVSK